ncbi:MAG: hypothetical protein OEX02_15435 [Cyclobacteriaceae bacterium]|nr:hypothetical protein [Cyclobacteriaceae bacterium]
MPAVLKSAEKSCAGRYRYGFNGKEKDQSGEFGGNTTYDYGFRINNPAIGRFLSVDPLTKSYPMLTPYQFASNTPIGAIDLDGLEARITVTGTWWQNQIEKAIESEDIERASFLTFKSLTVKLSDISDLDKRNYAKGDWKSHSPGSYNYSVYYPEGLTVYDDEGNMLFGIREISTEPLPLPTHTDPISFIAGVADNIYNFDINEDGGGFEFYTSSALHGKPIGQVRNGLASKGMDIKPIMDIIGALKETASAGKLAPTTWKFGYTVGTESIVKGLNYLFNANQIGETLGDNFGIEGKRQKPNVKVCENCLPKGDTILVPRAGHGIGDSIYWNNYNNNKSIIKNNDGN